MLFYYVEVSSQLSIEPDAITLKTNRLSWESDYSSMTQDGTLTCRNLRAINGYFSGRLETDVFYVDDDIVQFGDYSVSADGTGTLKTSNGLVNITDTFSSGPGKEYATLTIGNTLVEDSVRLVGTGDIYCARYWCRDDIRFENDSWAGNWGVKEMLKQIYGRLDSLRYTIQDMGGDVEWN